MADVNTTYTIDRSKREQNVRLISHADRKNRGKDKPTERRFWRDTIHIGYVRRPYVCTCASRLCETLAAADKCLPRFWQRRTVIQITNNTPPLTFYPTPEDKLQPTWDGPRARDYPPLTATTSSDHSSWCNRVSWTRLIPVVARPLGRHTELTRRSVFMDQARPDIPRKRAGADRFLSPPLSTVCSPLAYLVVALFLFLIPRRGGLINETGQAKHYYLLYNARTHWRGNVCSLLDYIPRGAVKSAEGTWTVNFESRSRPR